MSKRDPTWLEDLASGVSTTGFEAPKRTSTADAGKDPLTGEIIPHMRDDKTAGQVEAMTACGFSVEEIAVALNLRPGQVKHYYAAELEASAIRANLEVAKAVYELARSGKNLAASQFWLRNRAGWTENEQADGQGIAIHVHL